MAKRVQKRIQSYYRIKNGNVERVRSHWWPSDRYFKGVQKDRKVRAWSRRRPSFQRIAVRCSMQVCSSRDITSKADLNSRNIGRSLLTR